MGPGEALSSLIEELLEKDAERRPASAARVAETLREIAGSPQIADIELPSREAAGDTWMTAPSDVPTEVGIASPSAAPGREKRRRPGGVKAFLVALAALGLLAALVAGVLQVFETQVPELRVVVLQPEVSPDDATEKPDLTSFAVLEASLATLATLEGLDAVAPSRVSAGSRIAEVRD